MLIIQNLRRIYSILSSTQWCFSFYKTRKLLLFIRSWYMWIMQLVTHEIMSFKRILFYGYLYFNLEKLQIRDRLISRYAKIMIQMFSECPSCNMRSNNLIKSVNNLETIIFISTWMLIPFRWNCLSGGTISGIYWRNSCRPLYKLIVYSSSPCKW